MAKWDQAAANKKAQQHYKEIAKEGLDLAQVMRNVSKATKVKHEKNQKLKKKQVQRQEVLATKIVEAEAEQLHQVEAELDSIEIPTPTPKRDDPGRIAKVEKAMAELDSQIRLTLSIAPNVSDVLIDDLEEALDSAREAVRMLQSSSVRSGFLKRVAAAKITVKKISNLWDQQKASLSEEELQRRREIGNAAQDVADYQAKLKAAQAKGKSKDAKKYKDLLLGAETELKDAKRSVFAKRALALIARDDNNVVELRGTVKLALKVLGASIAEKAHAGMSKVGAVPGRAYNKGVEALISRFESSPVMVKSIKQVDSGLRAVGNAVKLTGKETLKWINKHLSGLASKLWSFLKSPFSGGGGGFGMSDLLGLAVLGPSVIKPLLEGIDKALSEKYGEHYIQNFFSGVWDSAKTFVSDQIKVFIDWISDIFKSPIDAIKNFFKPSDKATTAAEYQGKPVAPTTAKTRGGQARLLSAGANVDGDLLAAANTYASGSTPQQKADAKAIILDLLKQPATVSAATKQRLDELGFSTTNLTVKAGTVPFTRGATGTRPISIGGGAGRGSVNPASASPVAAGSGSIVVDGTQPPMDGDVTPVTATPKSPSPSAGPEATPMGGKSMGGGGATVGSIPVNVTPDSMYAMNLGVLA